MSLVETKMIKEFFDIYRSKVEEYGQKIAVFFACGVFYEIYEKDEGYGISDKVGNAKVLSEIMQMKYTGKNIGSFINFIGFTKISLDKYINILLNEGYTIVVVDELETSAQKGKGKGNIKRGITAIHSPALSLNSIQQDNETNLVGLLLEIIQNKKTLQLKASICCINNLTNDIQLSEESFEITKNLGLVLDELNRILYRCFPKQLNIYILDNSESKFVSDISIYIKDKYDCVKIDLMDKGIKKAYSKELFQNEYFENIYKHLDKGMLSCLEFLELNKCNCNSIVNFMMTLDFMGRHSLTYINNLNKPTIIREQNFLILELNTLNQLNIVNEQNKKQSLLNIIDFTKTVIGKRSLKQLLCKPFKNKNDILLRYKLSEELIKSNISINEFLDKITDFEKAHRKMGLEELHPCEFEKLHKTYLLIISLIDCLTTNNIFNDILPNKTMLKSFEKYMYDYTKLFNIDEMKNHSLNSSKDTIINYFNRGQVKTLDIIQDKIKLLEINREEIRVFYNDLISKNNLSFVKLEYSERENSYLFSCTKIRYNLLLSKLTNEQKNLLKIKTNISSTTKFYTDELVKLSNEILLNRDLLTNKIRLNYINVIKNYYLRYNDLFNNLKTFVEITDITNSNCLCVKKLNFTKPELISNKNIDGGFIEAKQIKHPIVESLGINYIANDITLNDDKTGMLIYGLNSSGKSTLLRAIGVNIILAQCGLYVSCRNFKFFPFDTIISQVDLTDDLFTGKSSFVKEMYGLKRILECSGKFTLVLSDELCKGTEVNSATSIVSSSILTLLSNNTKFFFTSHLHDIPKIKEIINLNKLTINHLAVTVDSEIIFERKLLPGSGSDLYGLELCKSILNNSTFIDTAFNIRNNLVGEKTSVLSTKKSRYNKKKIIDKCQICDDTTLLEIDHIIEQELANKNGFLPDGKHKNHISNLCTLCKSCHLKKTLGHISINGYKSTSNGQILDFLLK